MKRLFKQVYHLVHTHGWLADWVYQLARPGKRLASRWRKWQALRHPVTPEALYPVRQLTGLHGLIIGVTNICNARCVFCAYPRAVDAKELKGGVMSFAIFKKVVDEWRALGGDNIDLTHTVGDPLIDPGLIEKINYGFKTAGMKKITFITNGILLNRNDNYRKLIDAGVSEIYISTSGVDREDYEKTYGVQHYDEMLSGVHNLLRYNRERGEPTFIAIRFRNGKAPSQIIAAKEFQEKIRPFFSARVRCNFTVDFDNWGGLIRQEELTGRMRLRTIDNDTNIPCGGLFSFMVRFDGSVRLCGCRFKRSDMDDMVVGNIKDRSLLEISQSPEAWKIIEGFYVGKRPETCLDCTLYSPVNAQFVRGRAQRINGHLTGTTAPVSGDVFQ